MELNSQQKAIQSMNNFEAFHVEIYSDRIYGKKTYLLCVFQNLIVL